ncbi:MAG: hypothetical protein B9S34_10135 [Opitutia bacterium Tous-C1TDCM]|nr:MAG: hypothetical protein B9S34_10135 [Opitutae bacterium Tous-C1TDCM]PAW70922.1 MAG: hypothetical protein B9S38_07090 [Verrucomicrobiae bacterium Tous-C4TDCM]
MKSTSSPLRSLLAVVCRGLAGILLLSGCGNIFIQKHRVLVDAIAAPDTKVAGKSYRLIARKSVVGNAQQVQVQVVKACVDAALTGIGMFEAPEKVPPDVFVEVGFGSDSAGRSDPKARETFVQFSGRTNPGRSLERATGGEIFDVKVAVLGLSGRMESAMPVLTAVAAKHIGADTKSETKLEIPHNAPEIESVRLTAIKTLEAKQAAAPALPPSPPPSPAAEPPAAARQVR